MKKLASLCLILIAATSAVQAASKTSPAAAPSCDRECLRSMLTATLYAFLRHDTSKLPLGDKVRITEDAIEKPIDKVALVKTVTKLRGYRQDFLDERDGVATTGALVEEVGAPVMLVVRLKVVAQKITEMELVATRSRADGLIFNIDGLSAPSEAMNYAPRPEQLNSREEVLKASLKYPEGLSNAEDLRRCGGALHRDGLSLRERPDHGGPGLQVRAGLPEHLHPVARHLQSPGQGHDSRRRRRRATGHRLAAPELGRARAHGRSAHRVRSLQGVRRQDPRGRGVHPHPAGGIGEGRLVIARRLQGTAAYSRCSSNSGFTATCSSDTKSTQPTTPASQNSSYFHCS